MTNLEKNDSIPNSSNSANNGVDGLALIEKGFEVEYRKILKLLNSGQYYLVQSHAIDLEGKLGTMKAKIESLRLSSDTERLIQGIKEAALSLK